MFVGHYGVAFAAGRHEKRIPLWAYCLAVQWVDVLWTVLVLLGVEKVRIQPGVNPSGPLVFDYYPYTHSLMAAVGWAAVAFGAYRLFTRMKGSQAAAAVLALCVASHWVLDFLVHQPDLDLVDESRKVGLGLWNYPMIDLGLEFVLLFGGLAYFLAKAPELSKGRRVMLVVACLLMGLVQLAGFLGPPPPSVQVMAVSGLAIYLAFTAAIYFIAGRRAPAG